MKNANFFLGPVHVVPKTSSLALNDTVTYTVKYL